MGVELEVDCGNVYQAAEELMQNFSDRVWLTWDGSLDDGFEIITYPCREFEEYLGRKSCWCLPVAKTNWQLKLTGS